MENNTQEEKKKKKGGLFKLTRTRIAALGAAVVIAISLVPNIGNHDHDHNDLPNDPDTSITQYDPNWGQHDHDHDHSGDVSTTTPGTTGEENNENTNPGTTTPGENNENTNPGTTTPGETTDKQHTHFYTQVTVTYKDNGDGTHTKEVVGTCPRDGATKVLSKGQALGHNYDEGVLDPVTGDTTYTCKDCGSTRVVEKTAGETHTHDFIESGTKYEDNGDGTHTLVTIGTCKEDGTTKVLSKSEPVAHRENGGVVDPKTGDTVYTCLDCGAVIRTVKKGEDVHTHNYTKEETRYVNNGNGTHTAVVYGICPEDGAEKVLSYGKKSAHREDKGVVDPKTGNTTYTCLDCGATRVVQHTSEETHTHDYSKREIRYVDNGNGTHTAVVYGICPDDGAEKKISSGKAIAHREDRGTVDPKTGDTTYRCLDCGAITRVVKKGTDVHTHNYSKEETRYVNNEDGTHTAVVYGICPADGAEKELRKGATTGHREDTGTVDPKTGDVTYRCLDCGAITRVVKNEQHTHDYSQVTTDYVNNGDGTHTKIVYEVCPADGAKREKSKTTESHHEDQGTLNEATGETTYKCTDCGAVIRVVKPGHTHTWSEPTTKVMEHDGGHATATIRTCSCGETDIQWGPTQPHDFKVVSGDESLEHCTCGATQTHTHDMQPYGQPFEGKQGYKCACGKTEERSIHTEAQHEFKVTSSETKEHGDGHADFVTYTCSCGATKTDWINQASHSFTPISQTEEKCSCGATQTHEHNFQPYGDPFEGKQGYKCACGKTEERSIHTESQHNWVLQETIGLTEYYSCSCGATKTEQVQHTHAFTPISQTEEKCSCGATQPHEHNFQPYGEPFEGEQGYKCVCGATDSRAITPPTNTVTPEQPGEVTEGEEIVSSEVEEVVKSETEEVKQAENEFSEVTDTSTVTTDGDTDKQTTTEESTVTETTEVTTEDTKEGTEEKETVTVQVEIPAINGEGESTVAEFKVPAEIADTAMEEIKSTLSDAIVEATATEEVTYEEASHVEASEDEDAKVFSLDNNKYYY